MSSNRITNDELELIVAPLRPLVAPCTLGHGHPGSYPPEVIRTVLTVWYSVRARTTYHTFTAALGLGKGTLQRWERGKRSRLLRNDVPKETACRH